MQIEEWHLRRIRELRGEACAAFASGFQLGSPPDLRQAEKWQAARQVQVEAASLPAFAVNWSEVDGATDARCFPP